MKYYSEKAIHTTIPECSIYEYMYQNNKDYPQDIALNYVGRKMTYASLFENIDKTAAAFVNLGVTEHEIVTIALPSIPEALYCVYALNKIGAVANMIHPLAGRSETIHYINEVQSRVVIIFDKTYETLKDITEESSAEQVIVASPGDSLSLPLKIAYTRKVKRPHLDGKVFLDWQDFIKNGKNSVIPDYKKDCHRTAIISHTGGTTGVPKGVMCSDVSCNSLMWQIVCNLEYDRQEICMAVLPPFVNYSLVESMMGMLAVGFQVVLLPKYEPDQFVKYVRKYHPNDILSIPPYWEALLNIKDIEKEDLSCLKHLIYGGEAMSKETEEAINNLLHRCGAKTELCKGIGATEMVGGATVSYKGCNPPDSVGIPMVHTNCKIVIPGTTEELTYYEEGEICFSGDTLMLGYYNNKEATDEAIQLHSDGHRWLHTGDIGYISEDGILFVTGRIKRILMTKDDDGQVTKLFPERIEKVVSTNPAVDLCCVVGVPNENRINYPKAFVILNEEDEQPEEIRRSILTTCKSALPEYMVPDEIEFRSELPRTERGKVDYRALEEEVHKTI